MCADELLDGRTHYQCRKPPLSQIYLSLFPLERGASLDRSHKDVPLTRREDDVPEELAVPDGDLRFVSGDGRILLQRTGEPRRVRPAAEPAGTAGRPPGQDRPAGG